MNEVPKLLFGAEIFEIAIINNASADGDDAIVFCENLYREYHNIEGEKPNYKKWLKKKMLNLYKYVDKPPIWIESEPCWPYLDNEPMVFLHQFTFPDNEVSKKYLLAGDDEIHYVFAGRELDKETSGYYVKFKVVTQLKGF